MELAGQPFHLVHGGLGAAELGGVPLAGTEEAGEVIGQLAFAHARRVAEDGAERVFAVGQDLPGQLLTVEGGGARRADEGGGLSRMVGGGEHKGMRLLGRRLGGGKSA